MPIVKVVTKIKAPIERVFDLCRSVDLHVRSAGSTKEKAIAGTTSGLLGLHQQVTWRGKHFGVWQDLTVRIDVFTKPEHFRDLMLQGAFQHMHHDHWFSSNKGLTVMKDVFEFSSPLGILGMIADKMFLTRYMRRFIVERNKVIKRTAESDDWKFYLKE